jgi:molybdopterin/thiamine biosynthesis adenylyltransferase
VAEDMAERPDDDNHFFSIRREEAVERLHRRISQPGLKSPVKLQDYQIQKYAFRGAVAGWEFYPPLPSAPGRCLRIFVDGRFPFTVPKVAIFPAPTFLKYPHIERDGYLCIDEKAVVIDEADVEGVVDYVIKEALQLIDSCFSGHNQADFQDELLSYWERAKDPQGKKIYSLLDPQLGCDAAMVKIWRGEQYYLVSNTEDGAKRWLENKNGKIFKGVFQDALLAWPTAAFKNPDEYPKNSKDVHEYIKRCCDERALQIFESMTATFPEKINIVLGFQTKDGSALIGMTVQKPLVQTHGKATKSETFHKGFRPGKIPPNVSATRYLGTASTERLTVQRVDPAWVLSRDANGNIPALLNKKVTLVGCGAIGSVVARLLAQAGVGHLNLVDPDNMEWENTGRHALGADAVGSKKVTLLKSSLTSDFPHLVVSDYGQDWESLAAEKPDIFTESDLIVTTTGEWSADNAMNQYALKNRGFPSVIYGWAETFACAGHAVAILKRAGCLNCVFEDGKFTFEMTTGYEKELFRAPACGLTFQPFGSIELTPIVGMIAEMSIDLLLGKIESSQIRSWLGSAQHLRSKGGKWTSMAETLVTTRSNGQGYFRIATDFKKAPDCRACSGEEKKECDSQTEKQLQSDLKKI